MSKAKKEGKPKRNRKNLVKNIVRLNENNKILKQIRESLK